MNLKSDHSISGEKFESQCIVDMERKQLRYDLSDMHDKCKRPEGSDDLIKENQLLFMSEFGLSSKRVSGLSLLCDHFVDHFFTGRFQNFKKS